MFLRVLLSSLLFPVAFSHLVSAPAATWYVDGSASEFGDGSSWEKPLETIQEGIDAASDSDTVVVAEGTYVENIRFGGKNIILRSTDPTDPEVVAATIIDGNQAGSVVTFAGSENETCVLSGFTIRKGYDEFGGGVCGGTWENLTFATIRHNRVIANSAGYGGGIAYCNGLIEGNRILRNSASKGGALLLCSGMVRSNLVVQNSALVRGGGLTDCHGTIWSNTVCENSAAYGGGLYGCGGTIANCIIWGNRWGDATGQIRDCKQPTYSCIQGWTGGGDGNIADDPRFVDFVENDYRLSGDSPCIDAGKNEEWMWEAVDLDENPRILYGRSSLTVDMGAYEYVRPGITAVATGTGGTVTLFWKSCKGNTYTIWSCENLLTGEWIKEANVLFVSPQPSYGVPLSWTDPAPLGRLKFYRVEMK